jgi:hypothetical protein
MEHVGELGINLVGLYILGSASVEKSVQRRGRVGLRVKCRGEVLH